MKASGGMTWLAVLVCEVVAVGFLAGCSGDDNTGGSAETGVEGGPDVVAADAGNDTGSADSTLGDVSAEGGGPDASADDVVDAGPDVGANNVVDAGPGDPALPPDAGTVTCPTSINASLDSTDGTQVGRYSRVPPNSTCGTTKAFPGTGADPTNPHFYDVYRFVNPTAAPVCLNFTLTYGPITLADAGSDAAAEAGGDAAGSDASADGAGVEAGGDGAGSDASAEAAGLDASAEGGVAVLAPPKFLTAYSTFYPADLSTGYLGDVGNQLTSPQTMGITVPAGGTIDVVVYAIDIVPGGVGAYALSCTTQ